MAWLAPARAHAYTWMLKHGYATCPACHADPSGGELLTAYGRSVGGSELPTRWGGGGEGAMTSWLAGKTDAMAPPEDEEEPADKKKKKPKAEAAEEEEEETEEAAAEEEGEEAKPEGEAEAKPEGETAATEAAPAAAEAAPGESGFSSTAGFLWGLIDTPEWLLLGGSFRYLNIYKPDAVTDAFRTFPMQMDLYGQIQKGPFRAAASIGAARVAAGSPYARPAQVTTAQGKDWNLISRWHWIGLDFADGMMTLRLGRMNLPYGVRTPEHVLWVRQKTRTDRESSQQHGVALAYNGETMRGEIMGIVGNYQINPDDFRERGYSMYFEYFPVPITALGFSSLITRATRDRLTFSENAVTRHVHGVHVRAGFSPKFALLAEANFLKTTGSDAGYVGFLQADWEPIHSLHLLLTGEALDEGFGRTAARRPGAGKPQLGLWTSVNWFFFSHLDMRIDAIFRQEDKFTLLGQLHAYL